MKISSKFHVPMYIYSRTVHERKKWLGNWHVLQLKTVKTHWMQYNYTKIEISAACSTAYLAP